MATANGIKVVGFHDLPGGGQVVVRNNIAYVGHVKPPDGTSIIDVSDPSKPRDLARISVPEGTLSHKVRVENGLMLVNREVFPIGRVDPDFRGGLATQLMNAGYQVVTADDGGQAKIILAKLQDQVDLVIVDICLPDVNGLDVVRSLAVGTARSKIIVTTGVFDDSYLQIAKSVGADAGIRRSPSRLASAPLSGRA